jgi:hypothetical protein
MVLVRFSAQAPVLNRVFCPLAGSEPRLARRWWGSEQVPAPIVT